MFDCDEGDMDGFTKEEHPVTKTVVQSLLAIAIVLGLGIAAVLLLQIHYFASEVGLLVW
jgi:hypothetical protein